MHLFRPQHRHCLFILFDKYNQSNVTVPVSSTSIEGMASCDLPRDAHGCLAAGIRHQYRGYDIMWPPSCRTRLLWPPSCHTRLFGGRYWSLPWEIDAISMDTFVYASGLWETTLHCNVVSHWLGAYTKWSLHIITKVHAAFLYTKLIIRTLHSKHIHARHYHNHDKNFKWCYRLLKSFPNWKDLRLIPRKVAVQSIWLNWKSICKLKIKHVEISTARKSLSTPIRLRSNVSLVLRLPKVATILELDGYSTTQFISIENRFKVWNTPRAHLSWEHKINVNEAHDNKFNLVKVKIKNCI